MATQKSLPVVEVGLDVRQRQRLQGHRRVEGDVGPLKVVPFHKPPGAVEQIADIRESSIKPCDVHDAEVLAKNVAAILQAWVAGSSGTEGRARQGLQEANLMPILCSAAQVVHPVVTHQVNEADHTCLTRPRLQSYTLFVDERSASLTLEDTAKASGCLAHVVQVKLTIRRRELIGTGLVPHRFSWFVAILVVGAAAVDGLVDIEAEDDVHLRSAVR
mmetsp:Transcript_2467/g.5346  ORF Transcript_2467/g.5346 Transcript_2467/m.5346 type:complete len:217 (+) Transcript_2467:666-1316(+)